MTGFGVIDEIIGKLGFGDEINFLVLPGVEIVAEIGNVETRGRVAGVAWTDGDVFPVDVGGSLNVVNPDESAFGGNEVHGTLPARIGMGPKIIWVGMAEGESADFVEFGGQRQGSVFMERCTWQVGVC